MIVDNIFTSMTDYGFAGPLFVRAFDWLKATNLENLQPGTTVVIDGERVFAQVQAYTTGNPEDFQFESHRSFIDIQYIVKGREVIGWTPLSKLTQVSKPYDSEKDITFYADPPTSVPVELYPGDFAVFFPSDGHKPKGNGGKSQEIMKIVIKLSV